MSATDPVSPLAAPYSLRRRLMAWMLAGFAGIMAVMALGLWTYARGAADTTFDLLLDGAAISIMESVTMTPDGLTVDLPNSALEILGLSEGERVFYRVFGSDGMTLTGAGDLPLPPDLGTGTARRMLFDAPYSGEEIRFVLRRQAVAGPTGPFDIAVQVGHTRTARAAMQADLFWRGLAGIGVLAAIGLIFVRTAISLAMRPLAGIEADIIQREPSNFAPLKIAPPREIAGLIGAINDYMQRLGTNKLNAETFIADVAHQIRTSLAALRGQLDFAAETADAATTNHRLRKAADQAARTIRLTNQLLAHAMVMHRADGGLRERLDLRAIILGLLEEVSRDPAARIDTDFEVTIDPMVDSLIVQGDPVSLREALRNLIDNALRHAGPAPSVRILVAPAATGLAPSVWITVEDSGPGIAEADRSRALLRFTSLGGAGGSGLGLAIAHAAMTAQGGSLHLDRSGLGGLSVRLSLPLDHSTEGAV